MNALLYCKPSNLTVNEIVVLCAEEWSEGSHRITKRSLFIVWWMAASPFSSFSLVYIRMEQQQQQQLRIMVKRKTTTTIAILNVK